MTPSSPFQKGLSMRSLLRMFMSSFLLGSTFLQCPLLLNKYGYMNGDLFNPSLVLFILIQHLNVLLDFINSLIPFQKKPYGDNMISRPGQFPLLLLFGLYTIMDGRFIMSGDHKDVILMGG